MPEEYVSSFIRIPAEYREEKRRRQKLSEDQDLFRREEVAARLNQQEQALREQYAQTLRDARLNQYDVQNTNLRAGIAADAAHMQQGYTLERDERQTFDQLKRDAAQHGYTLQRDDQQQRNLLQRDEIQQGYTSDRDRAQFGYSTKRDRQQQFDQLQRDEIQQRYTSQNATQRETFAVTAKWQEQVQQAHSSGFRYSEKMQTEMNTLEEAFRVNVVNNPELDDSLKQDAMLKYQRKLSSFIPNERVQTQQESLDQSLQQHGVTKLWFQSRRNSQGVQEWEPLGGGRGGDKQVDPAKEAQRLQKLDLERATRIREITKEVTNARDPNNVDVALFQNTKEDPDVIDREVMKRVADFERIYTGGGNEPHPIFQRAAQQAAQKEREAQQKAGYDQWYEEYKKNPDQQAETLRQEHRDRRGVSETGYGNRADGTQKGNGFLGPQTMRDGSNDVATEMSIGVTIDGEETEIPTLIPTLTHDELAFLLNGGDPRERKAIVDKAIKHAEGRKAEGLSPFATEQQAPAAQKPPAKQKPLTISSTNIDQQITQSKYDGETEVAAALAAVKRITANGVPDEKSPEYAELYDALRFLNAKGVQIDGEPEPSKTDIYGDLMLNGMR